MTSFVSSLRHREKKRQRIQATINIVVETITIVNGSVPFPPAQAALESLCALLRIAIVRQPLILLVQSLPADLTLLLHRRIWKMRKAYRS